MALVADLVNHLLYGQNNNTSRKRDYTAHNQTTPRSFSNRSDSVRTTRSTDNFGRDFQGSMSTDAFDRSKPVKDGSSTGQINTTEQKDGINNAEQKGGIHNTEQKGGIKNTEQKGGMNDFRTSDEYGRSRMPRYYRDLYDDDADNRADQCDTTLASMASSVQSLRGDVSTSASSTNLRRIQIRDLNHIHKFASDGNLGWRRRLSERRDSNVQYDISSMPIENIIEMVAGLLTKITTTNDQQHEHFSGRVPPIDSNSSTNSQTSSVLAFHGKNVPSITILGYLNRINKYCPTSYEVFLSLLVYFDRMTQRVNAISQQTPEEIVLEQQELDTTPTRETCQSNEDQDMIDVVQKGATTENNDDNEMISEKQELPPTTESLQAATDDSGEQITKSDLDPSQFFVVDSFNIHRLVIAGVTCASKFFSDIFYTNSRYAKVGGLPLVELNHLELQFLLLNDFRLSVPVSELEAYGTMLVEFYAREVAEQNQSSTT